jgi:DNA polymerase-3 subunit alpha
MPDFVHLHVHSQYSILDGASSIPKLIKQAKSFGMKSLAITDHGNMFGAKEFHKTALSAGIKPILGCEVYVAKNHHDKTKDDRSGDHLILLARNYTGYQNLVKLVSKAWIEGFYYSPRIDKEMLKEHAEGLIGSSACIGGEIPQTFFSEGKEAARKVIAEYQEIFGEYFFIELQRHQTDDPEGDQDTYEKQQSVNHVLLDLARECGLKVIATNDVHFIQKEDAGAHDLLICLNTGKDLNDPRRMRYTRQEYLKSPEEMSIIFQDVPEAIENTLFLADLVEEYALDQEPIMPDFPLPADFTDEDEYLRHQTFLGARERYTTISEELAERIDFELATIKRMGFPGYFLIVQDFLITARNMGVWVGPGRGSAAGSVVAYCLRITDIDPIQYNLLFERFLNPGRVSMPDIDIDFDEDGRDLVLKFVVDKYGFNRVAQIITFGTMAAKSAIRDVARVLGLPLSEADRLAKLIPEKPGTTLQMALSDSREFREASEGTNPLVVKTVNLALKLEGSVRHTGLHACGIIICRDDLVNHIPVCKSKESDYLVTQYEKDYLEEVGMLKMDFLGLKTLSILKDAVENVRRSQNITIDLSTLPLDDPKAYEVFSKGETTSIFQFESDGMKKHLKELKPNVFGDLIAMNALYRPGPMEYIPDFIHRKNGRQVIEYELPVMEEILRETYGITVYQEQVMLLSQKMANFSKAQADFLRKAMGKKDKKTMDKMKHDYLEGCQINGHDSKIAEKIWGDWEKFAEYAFNKSHSTCYALVAYYTAWLKAHYPAEYMAAVLSRNLNDLKKITLFMDECRSMGMQVLGPDVNESDLNFTVNKAGNIRFGLGAIKGVGESAALAIMGERKKSPFKSLYDFVERINLSSANKKTMESLAYAGGFDCFSDIMRHQYFLPAGPNDPPFLEVLMRYGNLIQEEKKSALQTLFGAQTENIKKPPVPQGEEWSNLQKLNFEKEVIGFYLSAHPLDSYKHEIKAFCTHTLADLANPDPLANQQVIVPGMVTASKTAMSKNGNPYLSFTIEDYNSSYKKSLFGQDYTQWNSYFIPGISLIIRGKIQRRNSFNQSRQEETELELKIEKIEVLANWKEGIRGLNVKIPVDYLSPEKILVLTEKIKEFPGNTRLHFFLFDRFEGYAVASHSRNYQINLTTAFLDYLEQEELEFSFIR